jgi:hypothetical protein
VKLLLLLHVFLTLVAVVATANHWFLDAAVGAAMVGLLIPSVWWASKLG